VISIITIISKFNRTIEKMIKPIVAMALLSITLILCFNVIARYIFGFSLKWAEELANYTIVYVTFFGAVACLPLGLHISMDALVEKVSENTKWYLSKVNAMIGVFFSAALSYYGFKLVAFVVERGQLSPAMMIPMVIPYIAIPSASILLAVEFLEILLKRKNDVSSETPEIDVELQHFCDRKEEEVL
jgi:C4-dicarboxylate transporter DctQ subunit